MEFLETIEQHFPTPVLVRSHQPGDDLTAALVAAIEEARLNESNAAMSNENTTQGGFQTGGAQDFLEREAPALKILKGQIIWPAVERYLEEVLGCDPLLTPVSLASWAVSLGPGD